MSPRFDPAGVTELSRIGLLGSLPGETLAKLASRMEREQVAPGAELVREGEPVERFYVLLSGLCSATQAGGGERAVLRPGDHFGEISLAPGEPRAATVRAVMPSVVASCDRATFDELVRPLARGA